MDGGVVISNHAERHGVTDVDGNTSSTSIGASQVAGARPLDTRRWVGGDSRRGGARRGGPFPSEERVEAARALHRRTSAPGGLHKRQLTRGREAVESATCGSEKKCTRAKSEFVELMGRSHGPRTMGRPVAQGSRSTDKIGRWFAGCHQLPTRNATAPRRLDVTGAAAHRGARGRRKSSMVAAGGEVRGFVGSSSRLQGTAGTILPRRRRSARVKSLAEGRRAAMFQSPTRRFHGPRPHGAGWGACHSHGGPVASESSRSAKAVAAAPLRRARTRADHAAAGEALVRKQVGQLVRARRQPAAAGRAGVACGSIKGREPSFRSLRGAWGARDGDCEMMFARTGVRRYRSSAGARRAGCYGHRDGQRQGKKTPLNEAVTNGSSGVRGGAGPAGGKR